MQLSIHDESCPICGSALKQVWLNPIYKTCKNRCYRFNLSIVSPVDELLNIKETTVSIEIFCCSFHVTKVIDNDNIEVTDKIKEMIEYWKKDERYIAKILEMS